MTLQLLLSLIQQLHSILSRQNIDYAPSHFLIIENWLAIVKQKLVTLGQQANPHSVHHDPICPNQQLLQLSQSGLVPAYDPTPPRIRQYHLVHEETVHVLAHVKRPVAEQPTQRVRERPRPRLGERRVDGAGVAMNVLEVAEEDGVDEDVEIPAGNEGGEVVHSGDNRGENLRSILLPIATSLWSLFRTTEN